MQRWTPALAAVAAALVVTATAESWGRGRYLGGGDILRAAAAGCPPPAGAGRVLPAIQVLNGALLLALGVLLGSLQYVSNLSRHFFFFTFYTGYPFWGALFMQNSFGMNFSSVSIAIVGIIFLSINLAFNNLSFESCPSSLALDLCNYMFSSSTGLVSLMLIITLLELCITISVIVMWFREYCCK
ncbi:membrane-spanning 4-domains subfamily A member 3 [Rhynchocyon petersi]